MIRRPPRSTLSSSSAASDVYKRQVLAPLEEDDLRGFVQPAGPRRRAGSPRHSADDGNFHEVPLFTEIPEMENTAIANAVMAIRPIIASFDSTGSTDVSYDKIEWDRS